MPAAAVLEGGYSGDLPQLVESFLAGWATEERAAAFPAGAMAAHPEIRIRPRRPRSTRWNLIEMISRFLPHPVRRLLGVKTTAPAHFRLSADRPARPAGAAARGHRSAARRSSWIPRRTTCTATASGSACCSSIVRRRGLPGGRAGPASTSKPLWSRLEKKHLVMHGSDFDLRLLHDLCGFRAHEPVRHDAGRPAPRPRADRPRLADRGEFRREARQGRPEGQLVEAARSPRSCSTTRRSTSGTCRRCATSSPASSSGSGRLEWMDQQCQAQIEAGVDGFRARRTRTTGGSASRSGCAARGLAVLHAVWHWRQEQAQRLDTPPFKVCSNEFLVRLATAADEGGTEESVLAGVNLGKRHPRLIGSLAAAVRAGHRAGSAHASAPARAAIPTTFAAHPGRDRAPRPDQGGPRQDRREDRDRADADRQPLPAFADRPHPAELGDMLLPWQASPPVPRRRRCEA